MTLVVGVPVSLTGQFQVQGRQTLSGLQTWCQDANAASLDSLGPFQLLHYDDASDSATVREVTRRLIVDDKVDLLIGPYSSVLTSAAAQVAEEQGKLLWNQGGASDNVYQQGYRWIVGILTPASHYLVGLLPLVRRTDSLAKSVALLRASTGEFPRAVCAGVTETAESGGFEIVLEAEFDASCQDFTAELAIIEAAEPDVVVIVGRVQNDLRLARQLAESSINVGVVVAVAAGIQGFQDDLSSLAERFVGPSQWEPDAQHVPDCGPINAQVMVSFARHGHQTVDYPMTQAYAAGVVIQRCLEATGSADSQDLREAAASLQFSTFYGNFQIDGETGRQIGRETLLVQWQSGKKAIVWPQSSGSTELVYPWR
jgi:branched-chain amino acid transport system substrate-binding protein